MKFEGPPQNIPDNNDDDEKQQKENDKMSRRDFIKKGLFGALAVGVASKIPNELENFTKDSENKTDDTKIEQIKDRDNISWDVIEKLEGNELTGYTPKDKDGNVLDKSGVTIASGFDLGQRNEEDLIRLGLPDNMINRFKPFLGLRGEDAENTLSQNKLEINEDEARLLNVLIREKKTNDIIEKYNKQSSAQFQDLSQEQQTVIASVLFQYGTGWIDWIDVKNKKERSKILKGKPINFWNQAINKDWNKMYSNLKNFGDKYDTRRNREAEYLKTKTFA